MKQTLHLCFALCALLFASCGYDDSGILSRLDALEDENKSRIATLQQQIDAINSTLPELQQMDAELSEYITALQDAAKSLEQQIGDTNGDVSDLSNKLDSTIATLQEADDELSKDIEALEAYVNGELQNNKDWASATFATLEQYNALVANITLIEESIQDLNNDVEALEQRMGEKIVEEIATAVEGLNGTISTSIADLETSMKAWVNEQLAGYYTIAEVDAALEALQNSLDENNESLQEDIEELSTKVDNMEAELTAAYKSAIEEAIATNNGVIDGKIADAVASVNSRVDSEVAAINARIDALEERIKDLEDALDKIKTLDIVFDIESGKACMAGASIEFGYTIVGGDEDTEVESFGDGGWRADVLAADATSGRIRVTAPMYGGNGKVVVLATSGAGASAMKSIRFEEGILTDILDRYEVDWEACTLYVRLKTNVDYEVRIPAEAQSWLSVADTRAEVREDTLTFSISENPEDSSARTATVELVSEFGEVLQSFDIAQKMQPAQYPIQFADKYVKKVCVEKFDTNGDGELSYLEASKVKSIGSRFFGDYAPAVKSFDELQYFVNVTSILNSAFIDCSNLTSITIPESVTSIEGSAFYDCPNLKRVNISNLSAWYKILFNDWGNPLCNGANLYVNDELVTDIVIPSDIVSLNDLLFHGCTSIRSVVIPEGVVSIGYCAFLDCSSLTSIIVPESVTSIGYGAFCGCSSLTSITIPEGVTSIRESVFSGCSSLTSITIPEGVTSIGEYVFSGCSSLSSIAIPDGVTSIGNSTFANCSNLTSITIPEGVTSIGEYAFSGCSSLTNITIPDSVTSIGNSAFANCSSLTNITIPEGVTSIGESAFHRCSSLTNITIPDSVTSIGNSAFANCSSLTNITIPEGVTSIGNSAFANCSNLTSITIPEGVTSIGENAFLCCSSLTNITIPESVTSIGVQAFWSCSSLTSITIPEGITSIGNYAFYYCSSLTSITIPESVKSIGLEAFCSCSSLESVYCKAITPPVAGRGIFSINPSSRKIYVPMESVEAYKSADGWKDCADSIVGYDFENGVPEYDPDLVTVEIVDHGYFLCSDLVEIPGCEFFANDYYSNKVVFPVEFNIAGEFSSFFAQCYSWGGRNDEYSDDMYVGGLIYQINQFGSMSTQPTYVILGMNVDYYTYVAMAIDAEGHYSKLAKLKIVTSDEGVNKDITEFKEFWNRMQNS